MKTLQQRLKAKGFNPGAIDGIDGPLDIYRVVSPPSVWIFRFAWSPTKKPVARKGSAQTTTNL